MNWVWTSTVGGISGWIFGMVTDGRGFGIMGNTILGVIGAILGNWVFELFDISIGYVLESLIGAAILLFAGSLSQQDNSSA